MSDRGFFPFERNKYFSGKQLSIRDFEAEQEYYINKARLDRRVLNGAGVVCGFGITASDDSTLLIGSGMALDYAGNVIACDEPLIRKLRMLPGYETLKGKRDAWLCLSYAEKETSLVRAVKAEDGRTGQFNKITEGFALCLSAEAPDYNELFESLGRRNVNVLYASSEVTVIFAVPEVVMAGDELTAELIIVKQKDVPAVSVSLSGMSGTIECENDELKISYRQSPDNTDTVIYSLHRLTSKSLSGVKSQLFSGDVEFSIEYGHKEYKNAISIGAAIQLCRDDNEYGYTLRKSESLQRSLAGAALPIYLAKLELGGGAEDVTIASVSELPFRQIIRTADGYDSSFGREIRVSTKVRKLEYWQQPEVKANFFENTGTFAFDFGIPTPELYDYKISHGVVDIELPGGLRVNSRKVSEEIPHGLGPGNVDIRLSIEYQDQNNEQIQFSGNTEVFRQKTIETPVPLVEAAAMVYPERGTMRIGVWLHDTIPGNRIRVHYFAQKPEYDTDRLLSAKKAKIRLIPEVSRVLRGEKLNMKAIVTGCEDDGINWSIKDPDGGIINANGLYEAPAVAGTYEIIASAAADPGVMASAFVIVE